MQILEYISFAPFLFFDFFEVATDYQGVGISSNSN